MFLTFCAVWFPRYRFHLFQLRLGLLEIKRLKTDRNVPIFFFPCQIIGQWKTLYVSKVVYLLYHSDSQSGDHRKTISLSFNSDLDFYRFFRQMTAGFLRKQKNILLIGLCSASKTWTTGPTFYTIGSQKEKIPETLNAIPWEPTRWSLQ